MSFQSFLRSGFLEWQNKLNKEKRNMAKANCNWWLYSKYIYNIGRTAKYVPYTEEETEAVKTFILAILESRPAIAPRVNLKMWNSLKDLDGQNVLALGAILQVIGRNLKQNPPTEEEKELCDALMEATANRKNKIVSIPSEEEEEEIAKVALTAAVDPENGGSVSGAGNYDAGSSVEVTATAAEGYTFSKWEDDSTANPRTVVLGDADKTITAIFTVN